MHTMQLSIDRNSAIPIYYQIEEYIQERIDNNDWPPDTKIPTEFELCDLLQVSRSVVRQAIANLVNQGLLYRSAGKGTFVARPKVIEGLIQSLTGFYEEMAERGITPVTKVLRQEILPASAKIAKMLQIPKGEKIIYIERLRGIADGDWLTLSTSYIPYNLAPDLINADLNHNSLYKLLESYGLDISTAEKIIEAVRADEESSLLLGVEVGSPLLKMTNVSFLKDGTPFEFYIAKHSGERSKMRVRLVREGKSR